MSGMKEDAIIDVRGIPPPERHRKVIELFEKLSPGQTLCVINDHEPVHLLQYMIHEREDFDSSSYKAVREGNNEWHAYFRKSEPRKSEPLFTSLDDSKVVNDERFSAVPFVSSNHYRVILTYFKKGQFIPVHSPGSDLIFFIHKGDALVVAGERKMEVSAGSLIFVPRNTRRGILARTDMEALHVVAPPPSESDHEEVELKLKKGTFE